MVRSVGLWRHALSEFADMGIGRDFDADAHNRRVQAWRDKEAAESSKKLVAVIKQVQGPDAAPSNRASADAGPIYPLVGLCRAAGLPEPIPEYKFHFTRKWRADYCWPIHKILVEIDGAVWSQGRHTRGAGFIADQQKLNAAALLGYRVLRYTPDRLGECIADLRIMFAPEAA
jgi:hypothetical protein